MRPNKVLRLHNLTSKLGLWKQESGVITGSQQVNTGMLSRHREGFVDSIYVEQVNREILLGIERRRSLNQLWQHLTPPLDIGLVDESPMEHLFYFNPTYGIGTIEEPIVYHDGSYSIDHTFNGVIGISTNLKPNPFIKVV